MSKSKMCSYNPFFYLQGSALNADRLNLGLNSQSQFSQPYWYNAWAVQHQQQLKQPTKAISYIIPIIKINYKYTTFWNESKTFKDKRASKDTTNNCDDSSRERQWWQWCWIESSNGFCPHQFWKLQYRNFGLCDHMILSAKFSMYSAKRPTFRLRRIRLLQHANRW